jgi:hypothetical protein
MKQELRTIQQNVHKLTYRNNEEDTGLLEQGHKKPSDICEFLQSNDERNIKFNEDSKWIFRFLTVNIMYPT